MLYITLLFLLSNVGRTNPLIWDSQLSIRATERAEILCAQQTQLSHAKMTKSFDKYPAYSWVGENIARGYYNSSTTESARAVNTYVALTLSESHKRNILDSQFKYTGIGTACDITVQLFADKMI